MLLAAGAVVGFAALWFVDLSWLGLVLTMGLVAAYELVVYRIGTPPETLPTTPTAAPPTEDAAT